MGRVSPVNGFYEARNCPKNMHIPLTNAACGDTTLESMVKQFTGMILEMVAEDGVEIMKNFEKLHIC
ncbi:hypothetical protein PC116_g22317 [Phytophthora cactorum]|uniref:Uncharacterized protein n=1 Tax=Phytophthora cactorum TaxID=29920 RepID=A0A329RHI0_9STRA|nr:hypothetical protein Pcac1_g3313 [Phytophthora cactorum]KAG2801296.1 hypothetical protein PC111_g19601 [Phytophthora cactorum]KAG2880865.1 hypothetical protein PC114_g21857 [Phytophthora cactorum]KAG2908419.1 hypothetical protein PC117_g19956 [Phytophthora cactorum]KAG2981037.1 hypothetical protein PC119_g21131 [Phytophthora cactorum]